MNKPPASNRNLPTGAAPPSPRVHSSITWPLRRLWLWLLGALARLSVSVRLGLALGIPVVSLLVIMALTQQHMFLMRDGQAQRGGPGDPNSALVSLRGSIASLMQCTQNAIQDHSGSQRGESQRCRERALRVHDQQLDAMAANKQAAAGENLIQPLRLRRDEAAKQLNEVWRLLDAGQRELAASQLDGPARVAMQGWSAALDALAQHVAAGDGLDRRTTGNDERRLHENVFAVGLFGVLAAALVGLGLVQSLRHQLGTEPATAAAALNRFAEGRLGDPLPVRAGDQHSLLAVMERMRAALHTVVESLPAQREASPKDMALEAIAEAVKRQHESMLMARNAWALTTMVLENAPIGMITATAERDSRFLTVNRAMTAMLGTVPQCLIGASLTEAIHPEDMPRLQDAFGRLLDQQVETCCVQLRMVSDLRRVLTVEINVSYLRVVDGAAPMFILQVLDITERQETASTKDEFIALISHELRTPLTSLIGSLAMLQRMQRMNDEINVARREHLVATARRNADRLLRLINDILQVDKIAAGSMQLNLEPQSVTELVGLAVDANFGYAINHSVTFNVINEDPDAIVLADPLRVAQVMANLLSNAAKFSHPGGQIDIQVRRSGTNSRITVIDHGLGIAPEHRLHLFTKFYQGDSSVTRSKGGTGLGLFISRQLMLMMKGDIGFESTLGVGTSFWIELPLVVSGAADKHENRPVAHGELTPAV